MYAITENNGQYQCHVQIQDGVERWTEKSLDKAVDNVINCAKVMNHTEITLKDIRFKGHNVPDKSSRHVCMQKRKDLIWDIRSAIKNLREAMRGTLRGARIDDVEQLHDELRSAMFELEPWMPNRKITFETVVDTVNIEYLDATTKHGTFNSPHEGYAVIKEEVDELWDEVKSNGSRMRMKQEAIQIAAMAVRFCVDL